MTLRPPTLDDLGLLPTLHWHFERYRAETGVRVDFRSDGPVGRFAAEVETAAFRIVQEALTNVARHARVAEVEVSLEATAEVLELRVEDRGRGLRARDGTAGGSGGLAGMQERARLLGGRVAIDSTPGRGSPGRGRRCPPAGPGRSGDLMEPVRIVLADDHEMFRQGIRALLRAEADLEVVGEAGDGLTAARAWSSA